MSVESDMPPLTLGSLVLLDQDIEPYVLSWPEEELDGSKESKVLALMRREDGVLLAVPDGFLPAAPLVLANEGMDTGLLGPSCVLEVPGVVLDGGRKNPTGTVLQVLVVDCQSTIVELMRQVAPFEEIAFGFDPESEFTMPDPQLLLGAVLDWIKSSDPEQGLVFYSADGGEEPPSPMPKGKTPRRSRKAEGGDTLGGGPKQTPKPKRPTTASLSASLETLMESIPALSSQMQAIADRQRVLEDHVLAPSSASYPALSRPLSSALQGRALAPSAVVGQIRTPPRTGPAPNPGLLRSPVLEKPQDVLELEKEKQESVEPISNATLAQAVLAQSHALNSLVSQIAQSSSDPLVDLGGLATTGTRGSMGRAKLQNELASQKGLFFQSVMQAMARRMSPTVPVDGSPTELMNRGICGTRYLERFGGYAKHRDLGMIQYQVMSILDFLQTENWTAARDSAALLSVCLEQAVLDGGRFELAGVLCLQDDLPASIFVNRQAGALSRSRSFAPLADQRWITTALAYLKELDSIQSKRGELSGLKATASDLDRSVAPKANPKKKGGKPSKGGQKGHVENDPDEA